MDWDSYFMNMAYLVAMRSKDQNTRTGAVIIGPDKEIRATGYNSFPRGLNDNRQERQERPEKYFWFEHAEKNAIYNAARVGTPLKDCIMYTNMVPCMDCAKGIIQAGIVEVVVDKNWDPTHVQKWAEHAKRTRIIFEEAGIKLRIISFKLTHIEKFQDGKVTEKSSTST